MKMKTDTIIKSEGMDALFEKLGLVDAERFISLMLKEHFDYTKWQKDLFEDEDVEAVGNKAYKYARSQE